MEDLERNYIGPNLRFLRKAAKLSQEALAEKVDMNRGNIASYEKGTAEPNVRKLSRLVKFFNVRLTDFIEKDLSKEVNEGSLKLYVQGDTLTVTENIQSRVDGSDFADGQPQSLKALADKYSRLKLIYDGLHGLHEFSLPRYTDMSRDMQRMISDHERLLDLTAELLEINRSVLSTMLDHQESEMTNEEHAQALQEEGE